jgi:thiol reductant ABC exporter CydD subunit
MRAATLLGVAMAAAVVAQATLLARVIASSAVHGTPLGQLTGTLAALAAVVCARAALAGGFELSGRLGALRVMTDLRARLAEHLLVRAPTAREEDRTGTLAAAAVQGVDSLEAYFAGYLPQLILAVAVPVAILIWIVPIDAVAAAVLAFTIPVLIVFMILVGKGAQARARSRWQVLGLLSGHFLDVVQGLSTLRAFRREDAQAQTLELAGERYRAESMGTLRVAFLSALVLELCAMAGTALVAATIGVQLDGGHLSLQAGLTVLLLAPELYGPLRSVGQQFHAATDGIAAAERIYAVLDEPEPLERRGSRPAPDPAREPLRFEGVSFAYPDREEEQVLRDLDLVLEPGAMTVVTGPSGTGKSTMAALVLRLADPQQGRVTCGGVDLRDVDPQAWRAHIAWVPQDVTLFAGTLAENVALADPQASRERILVALTEAGLQDFAPLLDARIGEGARGLSAGQIQRVGLARAFLRDAPLLILDEPTAHLDTETAAALGEIIERLAAGRTTLLITHDERLAARAELAVSAA